MTSSNVVRMFDTGMIDVRLLNVVGLFVADKTVTLSKKLQLLVAALFGSPGRPVTAEVLIDRIWTEDELARLTDPRRALQDLIRDLREALDATHPGARAVITTRRNGTYTADVDTQQVDAYRFQFFLDEARRLDQQGDLQQAATRYGAALGQWTGDPVEPDEPLAGLYTHWADGVRHRLQTHHLPALLGQLGVELRLRQHARAVPWLERLTKLHPYNEHVTELLMRALCLAGQRTRALEVYRELHARLRSENGDDPGDRLQRLYQQILNHDEGLQPPMNDQSTANAEQVASDSAADGRSTTTRRPRPDDRHTVHVTVEGDVRSRGATTIGGGSAYFFGTLGDQDDGPEQSS